MKTRRHGIAFVVVPWLSLGALAYGGAMVLFVSLYMLFIAAALGFLAAFLAWMMRAKATETILFCSTSLAITWALVWTLAHLDERFTWGVFPTGPFG